MMRTKTFVYVKCGVCKVKFKIRRYLLTAKKRRNIKHSICSRECHNVYIAKCMVQFRSNQPQTTRKCRLCNKKYPYGRKANYYGQFCSDKCRDKDRTERYRKTHIVLQCNHCHKDFEVKAHWKFRKFCTRKCWRVWYRKVGVVKMMKTLQKKLHVKPNNSEKILIKILKPYGFKYVGDREFFLGRYNPDFVNHKRKLVIELFGEYWHKKGSANKRRMYFLRRGYDCMVIWHSTLIHTPERVVSRLDKFTAS